MALDLGKVKIRRSSARHQSLYIVKKVQTKIHQTARYWDTLKQNVFVIQMPATRTHQQQGGIFLERIVFTLWRTMGDRPVNRVTQINLPIKHCLPRG